MQTRTFQSSNYRDQNDFYNMNNERVWTKELDPNSWGRQKKHDYTLISIHETQMSYKDMSMKLEIIYIEVKKILPEMDGLSLFKKIQVNEDRIFLDAEQSCPQLLFSL